VSEWVFS